MTVMDVIPRPTYQRAHHRFMLSSSLLYKGDQAVGEGVIINLSITGCAIHAQHAMLPGKDLTLRLVLPDHALSLPVEQARVRWGCGRFVGVEFMTLPDEAQDRLRNFLWIYLIGRMRSGINESAQPRAFVSSPASS